MAGNSSDLIHIKAEQDEQSWNDAVQELENFLPQSEVDAATDIGAIIAAAGVQGVGSLGWSQGTQVKVTLYAQGKFVALDIVLDTLGPDSFGKALTKNIIGALTGAAAGTVASTFVLGALTGVAIAPIAAGAASVAVGYFAGEFVTNSIGDAWDYYIGPEIGTNYNSLDDSLTITTNGKLSDTLRNYWDGVSADVGEEEIDLRLDEWQTWTLQAADTTEEPLVIDYDGSKGLFEFTGVQFTDLRSINNASGEYRTSINLILEKYGNNFDAVVGSVDPTPHNIINYYASTELDLLADMALRSSDTNNVDDKKAAFILANLYTFYEEGVDDYNTVDAGDYSTVFLEDREAFLIAIIQGETQPDIYFEDKSSSQIVSNDDPLWVPQKTIVFGSEKGENIYGQLAPATNPYAGDKFDDHLYGMGGDDKLYGYGGDDYLEGGKGQDTMYGGDDNDTFYIIGEDDAFDTFYGGTGEEDTIQGSDQNDTIRVESLSRANNSIEIINGGDGIDTIAGTNGDNTIDLTDITVSSIERIEGGDGADTITGTDQGDSIYGGDFEDTLKGMGGNDVLYGILKGGNDDDFADRLEGGEGLDTYIVGSRDIISDSDNQGTIWFEGQNINGLILTQAFKDMDYYENSDNSWQANLDEDGSLWVSASSVTSWLKIENFTSGSFGITLEEYSAPLTAYDHTLTGTTNLNFVDIYGDGEGGWIYQFSESTGTSSTYINTSYFNAPSLYTTFEVFGGSNSDRLAGLAGSDHLVGGEGNDSLWGYYDIDQISSSQLGDILEGEGGKDWISGSGGEDIISGGEEMDFLSGWSANDTMSGGSGSDALVGGAGDDTIEGGSGDDFILGDGQLNLLVEGTDLSDLESFDLSFTYHENGFATASHTTGFEAINDSTISGEDTIFGGIGRDWIDGGASDDYLYGGDDHDILFGGLGNDTLSGDDGNDYLAGDSSDAVTAGDDTLSGGEGNDILYGYAGKDTMFGGLDDDQLYGGGGIDKLYGDSGADILFGGDNHDTMFGGSENDQMQGDQGNDELWGGTGDDLIIGDLADGSGNGNDTLYGESGDDQLQGGSGNDTFYGGAGFDILLDQTGDDHYHFSFGDGSDYIGDSDGENTIYFDDVLDISELTINYGVNTADGFVVNSDGADLIIQYSTTDTILISGGRTNSSFSYLLSDGNAFSHNDILSNAQIIQEEVGGSYAETMTGSNGNDILNGMDGADTLNGLGGFDRLDGGPGNDTLKGGDGNDTLHGREGDDWIFGEDGDDVLYGGVDDDRLIGGDGDDTLYGELGYDTLYGDAGNDTLYGGESGDYLGGGDGDDLLFGDDGNDTLGGDRGADILDGGEGYDTADYSGANDGTYSQAISINLLSGINSGGHADGDTLNSIEEIIGTKYGDTLIGGAEKITIYGGLGNDTIIGTVENDSLYGEEGNDLIVGGDGNDTLYGSTGDDTLEGEGGNDRLYGDDGADHLNGGDGFDTAVYESSHTGVTINLSTNEASGGDAEGDVFTSIEEIRGSSYTDFLVGSDQSETLRGRDGDDTITGGLGNDILSGEAGNDTFIFNIDDGADLIEYGEYESNTISFGPSIRQLRVVRVDITESSESSGIETLQLNPSNGDDLLIQYSTNGAIVIAGGYYYHDYFQFHFQDTGITLTYDDVNELFGDGDYFSWRYGEDQFTPDNISQDYFDDEYVFGRNDIYGSNGDDIIDGDVAADTIYGRDGNDTINGYEGDDDLNGGDGDDTMYGHGDTDRMLGGNGNDLLDGGDGDDDLMGQAGADTLLGGAGNDTANYIWSSEAVTIDLATGDVAGGDAEGDILDSIENVTGSKHDDQISGSTFDNTLDGGDGDDIIFGGDGNDILTGGSGADALDGGLGTDKADYSDSDNGIHINLTTNIATGGDAEGDTFTSIESLDGSAFNDTLTGDDNQNALYGGEGDDILSGGEGVDTINGGLGTDKADYTSSDAAVSINLATGLAAGGDAEGDTLISIENLAGSTFDDILTGDEGQNTLFGGAGNDFLVGGLGDDTYVYSPGSGADIIDNTEGGTDTLLFTDDITSERLTYIQENDNLVIRVDNNENTQVTVTNWFLGGEYQLSYIQPSGATGIPASQINDLFTSSPPPSDDPLEVPAESTFDLVQTGTSSAEQILGSTGNDLLKGLEGDDQLFAFDGDDWLLGGDGNDYFDGGAGNDTMLGGTGNDQLGGDAGNDYLVGGLDDDIYVYRPGSGADTIDNSDGGTDWLIFTDDLTEDRLTYHQVDDDLVIRVDGDENTQVTVLNWFLGGEYQLSYIQPSGVSGIPASQISDMVESTPPPSGEILEVPAESTFDLVQTGTSSAEQILGSTGNDLLKGLEGDDQLFAFDGDDWLLGGDGNDYFDGGAGNDTMLGGAGNDQLGGDAGNDYLAGGLGDDIYVYRPGSGADTIDNTEGGTDTLLFTDDITSDRLTYIQENDNLIVRIDGDETTQATVKDWFKGGEYELSYIQPAGASGIPASQINDLFTSAPPPPADPLEVPAESTFDLVQTGTSAAEQVIGSNGNDLLKGLEGDDQLFAFDGDDWLLGGDGNDYFDGGAGNDTMLGGAGNDQLGGDAGNDIMSAGAGDDMYVYRPGSDADTILNAGGGTDWLLFTDDITADRLSYWRSGDDLQVKVDNSNDTMVTVQNWFLGGENEVAYIQPAGGYGISAAQINTMVQDEPEAAAAVAMSDSTLGDMAASMTSGVDSDYVSYNSNAGLYLDSGSELGVTDDLSLSSNSDTENRELLAA